MPGGKLSAEQWLALDRVADLADGTMRLTTRQGVQFHMVHKGALRELVAGINASLLTTLAACGDVVRNVMGSPWPDSRQEVIEPLVDDARRPLPPADVRLLAAVGRRRAGSDGAAGAPSVPRSARSQAFTRADLRRCLPAAEVQDHRRLAGRQQRRRAGQRRRHRADVVRWTHGCGDRLQRVCRWRARHEPRPRRRHVPAARRTARVGAARARHRRRRGRRDDATRLRRPQRPPPRPPQVSGRVTGHRVDADGSWPAGGSRDPPAGRTAAVAAGGVPRHPRRRHRPSRSVRQGCGPRWRRPAHRASLSGRRRVGHEAADHRSPGPVAVRDLAGSDR